MMILKKIVLSELDIALVLSALEHYEEQFSESFLCEYACRSLRERLMIIAGDEISQAFKDKSRVFKTHAGAIPLDIKRDDVTDDPEYTGDDPWPEGDEGLPF